MLTDPAETPIGVVTAFFGAPFFILVLRTRQVRAMSSLEFARVTVRYDGASRACARSRDVVRSGEWLGLIGPNGAGKSSLLRAAVGLVDHGRGSCSSTASPLAAAVRAPAGGADRLRAAEPAACPTT